jgi:hypothetical protein
MSEPLLDRAAIEDAFRLLGDGFGLTTRGGPPATSTRFSSRTAWSSTRPGRSLLALCADVFPDEDVPRTRTPERLEELAAESTDVPCN